MLVDIAWALLDLIFPPRCAACGAVGAELCAQCAAKIRPMSPPRCARCGLALAPLSSRLSQRVTDGSLCRDCAAGTFAPALDGVVTAAIYEEPLRAALLALKFHGRRRAALPLARMAVVAWTATGLDVDLIVPLPLHRERQRQRGYNQAELLAREVRRALGIPLRKNLLVRTRATPAQAQLGWSERQRNMVDAFGLGPVPNLAGRRVLLLDDIITTGATIQAAGAALRQASPAPAAIYALAVARPLLVS